MGDHDRTAVPGDEGACSSWRRADFFTAETPGRLGAAGGDVVEREAIEASSHQISGDRLADMWATKDVM